RKFCFQIALQYGYLAGDHEFSAFYLRLNILFDELGNACPGEFTCSPGGKNGKSAGVVDNEVKRNTGTLQLSGYNEVSKSEVYSGNYERILVRAVQRVD